MFAVDSILISDRLLQAPFACQLQACRGACCVQGEGGAPLEPGERYVLESLLPELWHDLRPEAQAVISQRGPWKKAGTDRYATTCADDGACVFVVYEDGIARCALQRAYMQGRIDFPKPISCHLYPLRADRQHGIEILRYEEIPLCDSARQHGAHCGIELIDFLQIPLTRRYGASWYARFRSVWAERRQRLGLAF